MINNIEKRGQTYINATKKSLDVAEASTVTAQSFPAPPAVPQGYRQPAQAVGGERAANFLLNYLIRYYLQE